MPTSMTYNSLLVDLRRYLERGGVSDTEVFAQLPTLINLAERDLADKLKILGFLTPMTDVMAAGTSVYSKPDRWRKTASMEIGSGTAAGGTAGNYRIQLFPRSYGYCRMYWPDSTVRNPPEFYADYDYGHWLIVPTPDANYNWEVEVWQLPALLDVANQTNWTTDYAPNALLQGSLKQAWIFLKNIEREKESEALYVEQLSTLNGQDLQRIIDRSTTRREV